MQAQYYYQQTLQIKIEFSDRYEQASTYGQLGLLAEELQEYQQSQDYFLQALQIFMEFNDENGRNQVLQLLARLYQQTQDRSILVEAARLLGTTPEELPQVIKKRGWVQVF